MTDKPLAIAFSDLHINNWKKHNGNKARLKNSCLVLQDVAQASIKHGKIPILFSGDLLHNPKNIENETLFRLLSTYRRRLEDVNIPFYAISGNHDMSERNTLSYRAPSYLHSMDIIFNTFNNIDYRSIDTGSFMVFGIPYLNGNVGFIKQVKKFRKIAKECKKPTILLIHGDLHGAVDGNEYEIGEVEGIPKDMDKFFRHFTWVLSGHIHLPQKLGKNIYMLGSPQHQTAGDKHTEMGYWLVYKDRLEFVHLDKYPKFIDGHFQDDGNFWIEPIKVEEKIVDINNAKFNNKLDRGKIAKNYLKAKGIIDGPKKQALIEILRSV